MSTETQHERSGTDDAPDDVPTGASRRPPLVAMVVVGALMGLTLFALFRAGGDVTDVLLDEGESAQPAGSATFDLGTATLVGRLDDEWIRRERCPGWIQLNSMAGDATTVHVVATAGAPDAGLGELVEVADLPTWWADEVGVEVEPSTTTSLLDVPAVAGRLQAEATAPEQALLLACEEADGSAGVGIKGPAAGFEQYVVATTEPVPGLGTVVVLGAAWVGGDIDLARAEATGLAASLSRVDG